MKKILLIQSRVKPDIVARERSEFDRALSGTATLSYLSAVDESRSWEKPETLLEGFDGVILGGSGEFDLHGGRTDDDVARTTAHVILRRLSPLMRTVLEKDFPLFGVCFGHQLMAEMLGGNITSDPDQKKAGSYELSRCATAADDALFNDVPEIFVAQYGHKDAVTSMPEGAVLLASGSACKFSALRYGRKVYSTQFHPELTEDDVLNRFKTTPGYLPEGVEAESLVRPSPEASRLLRNFVERIL